MHFTGATRHDFCRFFTEIPIKFYYLIDFLKMYSTVSPKETVRTLTKIILERVFYLQFGPV